MSINIGDNFSYLGKKFLDARQSFDTLEAMRLCSDVPLGFITFCKEDGKRYEYGQNGWVEYNTGESITEEQKSQLQTAYEHSISDHVTPDEIADFATEDFVTNKIAEASLSGEVDLSGYVTDEELESKGYLTNIPDEYVTDEELNAKGYLTEHQDLSGYVTDEELNAKGYLTDIPDEYVTDEELNAKGYLTEHQDLSGYATKDYVTEKIEEASINGGDGPVIDLSEYVTEEELNAGLAKKIDNIEVNEVETTDEQTALDLYSNGAVLKTIYFSGGGGSAAAAPYISSTVSENNLLGLGEIFEFVLDFSSSAMGRGTAKILINDIEAISTSVNQGENTLSIPDTYFRKGENRVTIYVIDRTGAMSNNLVFYVRYGSLEITPDFDVYTAYDYGSTIRYYFTPTAVDTSLGLTMYMKIDGELKPGVTCYSETRGYFTFPSNLGVGAHYCEAYVIDSAGNISNVITFNLIILDATSLVVASDTLDPIIEEGEQLTLDYKVYMKNNTSFITKIYVDGALVNTGTCGLATSTYSTSSLTEGIRTIKLEVYDVTETVSDYITWTVTVTPSTYEMLQPINAGAMFIATSMNMSNSTENREIWVGKDQEGNTINATLNEFAFNQESGWVNNELLMTGSSSVDIPIAPLSNNARYGFTLDIEFASKAIGVEDALVLNLWDDEKNCGIKITTEQVIMRSAEGNEAKLYYTDDEMTSAIFIIDRNEATAKIYLNGVMCSAFHLSDYYLDGIPYLEDFTVNSEIKLGGSGHARIKNLRVYQVALTSDEILNNFMANETSKAAQKELVAFQKGDHLPTLTVYCDFSGLGKDDKKPCKIVYTSTDEEKYGKSFILNHYESKLQYQGTSSMAYPIKNYRLNLRDENGDKWYYDFPKGKPECRFTLKADFMSSGHWTNTGLTKWINDNLYNYNTKDEKSMNPKKWYDLQNGGSLDDTRECIYGFPCRLILINDGNTPLNEGQNEPTPGNTKDMGIFNFNHDKDATDTMGFDTDVFPNCASYEVTANSDTSAGAFMKNSKKMEFSESNKYGGYYQLMTLGLKLGDSVTYKTSKGAITAVLYYNSSDLVVSTVNLDKNEGTFVIPENESIVKIRFRISSNAVDWITLNGERYQVEIVTSSPSSTVGESDLDYIKQSFELRFPDEDDVPEDWGFMGIPGEEGTGLKVLIDWVDGSTDEEFVRDFEQHFNKDYTFRYFLLVITLGMVDNLGKNMMLDTWDNKIFMPRFYDCDTICSYDNSGQLKFDVDIEMAQGYWNTSSSRLWTRIRDLFHDELVAKYNDMRQNGLSYESLMQCFYDEQIAKIPQKYYNMDYDVKYAPFADSYIGMANGDVYEHVKRWLQQRLRFVDTLYDYAPSYNNDVLTIRANTTEPMTLYIETYTPVYQHLSWYNNQMDKKKIDGKIAVEFTGTAMAATDQEVLIYGGSNIKSIKGIQSMNPNRMLIGAATKLTELDASNCPLLADVNANKANFAPHVYLNKLDISGCPLLGGNLIVSNSPLLQEIDIQGTAITGLNLPSNLRNLKVLKLPAAISNLTLNDAGQLHTLSFENGVRLQNISMTNCNALVNVENFDIRTASSVTLNNSYSSVQELYFRDTANVSLSNMPNIERIIYTPNDEYAVFSRDYLANKPDYKISVFNAPKCTEFVVTAPQRLSYGLDDTGINPNTVFAANSIDISNTRFTDVKLLATTDTNQLKLPSTVNNLIIDSAYDIDTDVITEANYDFIHTDLYEPYNTDYTNKVEKSTAIRRYLEINNVLQSDVIEGSMVSASGDHPITSHSSWARTNYFKVTENSTMHVNMNKQGYTDYARYCFYDKDGRWIAFDYFSSNGVDLTCPPGSVYCIISWRADIFTDVYIDMLDVYTPDIVPSSSDGSLIFSMYAPSNTNEPASGTWDFKGLDLDTFYTFGLNNDIIQAVDGSITMPNRVDWYSYNINNLTVKGEVMRYTATTINAFPTFNSDFEYKYIIEPKDGKYLYHILSKNDTPLTMMKCDNSTIQKTITSMEYLDTRNINDMSYMFNNCENLTSVDLSNFDTKNVTNMSSMFSGCKSLTSLDVSSFDTKNVTNMSYMFFKCSNLTSLDLSNFDTSKVTTMFDMLCGCNALMSLDVSNFDTSNVTTMSGMFQGCNALKTLTANNMTHTNPKTFTSVINNGVITELIAKNWKFNGENVSLNELFKDNTTLQKLDLSDWNTSKVTNMAYMFSSCSTLTSLDISNFDTKNVTTMISMFYSCNALTSLDVSNFNTSNVTNMAFMFSGCSTLTSLDVSNFDTKNVNAIIYMFNGCNALMSLDVSNFDTRNINDMNNMFRGCSTLTSLDVSNFNTSNVTNMASMFNGCNALTSLDVSSFDTKNVTDMNNMFSGCRNITSLNLSSFDTKNVTNMTHMFDGCINLTSLNLSSFNTSNVGNMSYMFFNCRNLTSLDLTSFDTTSVTNMFAMLESCESLMSLNVTGWPNNTYTKTAISSLPVGNDDKNEIYASALFTIPSGWVLIYNNLYDIVVYTSSSSGVVPSFNTDYTGYSTEETDNGDGTYMTYIRTNDLEVLPTIISFNGKSNLLTVEKINTKNVTNMANMFRECNALTSLDVSNFDTTNVTDMGNMFRECNALTSLDVSNFDTTNVTSMHYMFLNCNKLTSLDVSNFDTTNVTTMNAMFNGCSALTSLDVSGFDTTNVTNMNNMFQNCKKLTSLDVSGFDTTNVTSMNAMFYGCNALTSLDLSSFDTTNVTDMSGMFQICSALTSLDLSNFDTTNVTSMVYMFYNCGGLTSLDVSSFNTTNVTNMYGMLSGCSALTSLDVSNFNTKKVTNMNNMFTSCISLMSLNVVGWPNNTYTKNAISSLPVGNDAKNEIYSSDLFTIPSGWVLKYSNPYDIVICTSSSSGVVPSFNTDYTGYSTEETDNGDGTYTTYIKTNDLEVLPTIISFNRKSNLLTVEKINTKNVTDMNGMFYQCNSLTSLDVSGFDTTNVTNMYDMFYGCKALTSLDLSNFDTTNVTSMAGMFNGCNALTSLDVSNFDTTNVTSMAGMFNGCNTLTSLDVSGFDTSNVTSMHSMFLNCYALTSLNVSNFDTKNVDNMNSMFSGCRTLTSLDISNFDTKNVKDMAYMFSGCNALTSLNVVGWPNNTYTQTAISSLPVGNDAKNEIYATTSFTVPRGWSLINNASMTMNLRQTDLDNLTDEEIAALVDAGWTIG